MKDFREGEVILINKPLTWSSFQVVNKMKYVIKSWLRMPENGGNTEGFGSKEIGGGRRESVAGRVEEVERKMEREEKSLENGRDEDTPKKKKITKLSDRKLPRPPKFKIGHAGTLDPLATGLLIVCTGKETKNIENYQAQDKEYTGTFHIGATTPSYDLEKAINEHFPTGHITDELIYETVLEFFGSIQQTPPIYSAIRVDGRRAYKSARAGREIEMPSKEINISEFEITRIAMPEVDFRIVCSKGTYIRSLARDFGEALGSGAHLMALCRTRIGKYKLEDAITIEEFERSLKN